MTNFEKGGGANRDAPGSKGPGRFLDGPKYLTDRVCDRSHRDALGLLSGKDFPRPHLLGTCIPWADADPVFKLGRRTSVVFSDGAIGRIALTSTQGLFVLWQVRR